MIRHLRHLAIAGALAGAGAGPALAYPAGPGAGPALAYPAGPGAGPALAYPAGGDSGSAFATPGRLDSATQVPIPYARNVVKGPRIGNSFQNPCWGPGSDRLVFTQYTQSYNQGSSITRTASFPGGALIARLSPLPPAGNSVDAVNEPGSCWSARENLIAYSGGTISDQIVVARPDGTGHRVVTGALQSKLSAWEPSFSPDGHWLVFEAHVCLGGCHTGNPNYSNIGTIWKVGLDGTGLTQLTCPGPRQADQQPNWAPTNPNLVVFQRNTLDARGGVLSTDLYTLNPGGRGRCARVLTAMTVRTSTAGQSSDASFSPDSSQLVYSGSTPSMTGSQASIFVLDVARDAPAQQVTFTRGIYDNAPSYSPDATRIAFESCPAPATLSNCPVNSDASPGSRIWTIAAP